MKKKTNLQPNLLINEDFPPSEEQFTGLGFERPRVARLEHPANSNEGAEDDEEQSD